MPPTQQEIQATELAIWNFEEIIRQFEKIPEGKKNEFYSERIEPLLAALKRMKKYQGQVAKIDRLRTRARRLNGWKTETEKKEMKPQ